MWYTHWFMSGMILSSGVLILLAFYRLVTIYRQKLFNQIAVLQKDNKQLKNLNTSKDKLFSIIAHDLKNQFHVVMGFSDVLLEEIQYLPPEKIQKFIQLINNASRNGNALLDNLLQWSRSQTGKLSFEPGSLNVHSITKELISLLEGDIIRKKIQLIQKIDPSINIFADENMLKTIMRNLISNAIKFTYIGGTITIGAIIKNNGTEITITDTGVGIAPEKIRELFEIRPHASTKGTFNECGTGLGLIICKEFTERHNGTIWVESIQGKGSQFKFSFPHIS